LRLKIRSLNLEDTNAMNNVNLLQGDCLQTMKTLPDNSVDAIVTDPPYGISFMAKKWDYDVPKVEVWQEAMRVLKPGGHALIACGTRTQHRMVVNIEDAGFEIRDVVSWIYGSGFPKSLNISKAIDKAAGAEREVVGTEKTPYTAKKTSMNVSQMNTVDDDGYRVKVITAPATDAAKQWDGWGTAMKPSTEYFTLAQKPLESSSDLCIIESINQTILCLLQSFVTTAKKHSESSQSELSAAANIAQWIAEKNINTQEGLFDLMVTLQSESETTTSLSIVLSCLSTLVEIYEVTNTFTTSTGSSLTTELRILKSVEWESIFQDSILLSETQKSGLPASALDVANLLSGLSVKLNYIRTHSATDSASSVQLDPKVNCEFFTLARKPLSEKTVAANVLKWGTGGINIDGCRLDKNGETPSGSGRGSKGESWNSFSGNGGNKTTQGRFPANLIHDGSQEVLDLFPETGKESAARFFYCAKASKKDRGDGNNHPTVKPTALMAYLCSLITPPGGIVLDPYIGSGSTGKAAIKEGFSFVGIELDPNYYEIACARVAQASDGGRGE